MALILENLPVLGWPLLRHAQYKIQMLCLLAGYCFFRFSATLNLTILVIKS